jgi:carboxyl-terminal processing protease
MIRKVFSAALLTMLLGTALVLPAAKATSETDGVWLTHGYGMLIVIDGEEIDVYDITAESCVHLFDEAGLEAFNLEFALENDELVMRDVMTLHYTAARLDAMPEICANGGTQTDDPEVIFEAFWNDFNAHYAFFELHGVDWQAQYDLYRPQVTASTTPEELFTILSEMISPLDDEHIILANQEAEFSPALLPSWLASPDHLIPTLLTMQDVTLRNYLKADIALSLETFSFEGDEAFIANPMIVYGKLSDTVGYVYILAEDGYTEDGDLQAAAEASIDRIIAEFIDLETVIVDVRHNFGGADGVALILASRFADEERLVWSKMARDGDGFAPSREFYVAPGGPQQFTGQVIVLTSQFTVSAGETFVLAMDVLPHVTVIGENTAGAYSDVLFRMLPNGWQFSFSNEIYTTADGEVYELVGNPPDVEVPLDLEGFASGSDNVLDAALELAGQ